MRFLPFTTQYFDELDTMFLQPKDFPHYIPNRHKISRLHGTNEDLCFWYLYAQWHPSHLLPHRSLKFVNENSTLILWHFPFRMHMESWFPLGLENRQNLENRESIFQSGIFAKTGKVWEFYPKYWKIREKLYCKIEKKILEKLGQFVSQ